MTAREKFIKRLEEEGLYEKWKACGDFAGKVCEDGTPVLFVHYEWDADDGYNEIHYPSLAELRDIESFREYCEDTFYENDDDKFVADLARWLHYQDDKCPLYTEDLYFSGEPYKTKCITFEDDPDDDANLIVEMVRYLGEKTGKEVNGIINGIKI